MPARPLSVAVTLIAALVCVATKSPAWSLGGSAPIPSIALDAERRGQAIDAIWWQTGGDPLDQTPGAHVSLTLENHSTSSGCLGLYELDAPWDGITPPEEAQLSESVVIDGALGSEPARYRLSLEAYTEVWPEGEVHLLLWIMEGDLEISGEGELSLSASVEREQPEDADLIVEIQ